MKATVACPVVAIVLPRVLHNECIDLPHPVGICFSANALPEVDATRMTMDAWWMVTDGRCMVDEGRRCVLHRLSPSECRRSEGKGVSLTPFRSDDNSLYKKCHPMVAKTRAMSSSRVCHSHHSVQMTAVCTRSVIPWWPRLGQCRALARTCKHLELRAVRHVHVVWWR